MEIQPQTKPRSPLHAGLSFLVPGLGQWVAGKRSRGFTFLLSALILGALSIWTIAQRARFPDYGASLPIFLKLFAQTLLLLIFLLALRRLLARYVLRDPAMEAFSGYGLAILYLVLVVLLTGNMLVLAGTNLDVREVHGLTAVLAAAILSGFWLWQAADAGVVATLPKGTPQPSMTLGIILICLLIFTLGYNITNVDLGKAISEIDDFSRLLPDILWPWERAFEYDQRVIEATQRVQAPCPPGDEGPPSNEPHPTDPWLSATPTCGDLGERETVGGILPGTELTLTGGNFPPGETIDILWRNPIGNPFTPRGVGDTEILVDENGEFTSTLAIPDVVISESTAEGALIHTIVARQSSERVFTSNLSADMRLALQLMLETIMIGLMATFFGIVLAFPLAFLAARNIMAPIVSTLRRITGSIVGLIAGIWLAAYLTGQVTNLLGGLERAPILIFLAMVVLMFGLGWLGLQLGGNLFARILRALNPAMQKLFITLLLGVLAALPGYFFGLAFSRGVRSIVLGAEVAAMNEVLYAYIGAALFAVLGAIYGARKSGEEYISVGMIVYSVVRTLMNIVRSIEPIIWGIVAVIWVGLGPFAGTFALTIHSVAALGKLYSEAIESIDPGPLEALQSTGANRLQTVVYAVIPQILPPFISFTIYRWDINVRMSTILGLVGGGGIGFILIQWMRLYQWEAVGIAVWLITITVAALDYVSSNIRERFV
jgi:phosphonate ABC transporter permease subunit PhnE